MWWRALASQFWSAMKERYRRRSSARTVRRSSPPRRTEHVGSGQWKLVSVCRFWRATATRSSVAHSTTPERLSSLGRKSSDFQMLLVAWYECLFSSDTWNVQSGKNNPVCNRSLRDEGMHCSLTPNLFQSSRTKSCWQPLVQESWPLWQVGSHLCFSIRSLQSALFIWTCHREHSNA